MTIEQIFARWNQGLDVTTSDFAAKHFDALLAEIKKLKQWVHDCQSGMYINCVYCGHRYGPKDKVPSTMAQVLKNHVERCKKHPMYEARREIILLRLRIRNFKCQNHRMGCPNGWWVTLHTCSCGFDIALSDELL